MSIVPMGVHFIVRPNIFFLLFFLLLIHIPFASADDHFSREEIIKIVIDKSKKYYNQSQFDKTVYVGDGIWDLFSTRRMGIPFLGIGVNGQESLLRKEGAKYILRDYSNQELFIELLKKVEVS